MTTQEIISLHSKPDLAKLPGMVRQVWEDGEITCQKSGELLWQRTLHCLEPGDAAKAVPLEWFPEYGREGKHAYIFTDEAGSEAVRAAILAQT